MTDMTAFERQLSGEIADLMGPVRPVNDAAIFTAITTTQPPRWRFQSTFSATTVAVAAVVVALLGGILLVGQSVRPTAIPGAESDSGTFSPTGSLAQPRAGHTATLLPDGRVLVVGGHDGESDPVTGITTAELWDPETGTFGPTGSIAEGRAYHSATLLPDGRVLVVGGIDEAVTLASAEISAEIWDPATGTFSPSGSLAEGRAFHDATLLPGGRVLISGSDPPITPEIWDPVTSTFSLAESLPGDLNDATALADGRVLLIDDGISSGETMTNVEVWDPVADTLSPAGSLTMRYAEHVTLLPDGRVLAVGTRPGIDPSSVHPAFADIWDPATGTFSPAGSDSTDEHYYSSATALQDGRVLMVGGCHGHSCHLGDIDSANVWDPDSATFSPTGSLAEARVEHTATLLADGRVLVVGGQRFEDTSFASAEIWSPGDG